MRSASFRQAHNTTGFATRALSAASSFFDMETNDTTSLGEIVYDQFGQPYVFDGEDWSQVGEQGWVPTVGRIETSHGVSADGEPTERDDVLTQENMRDNFDLDVDMVDLPIFNDTFSPKTSFADASGTRRRSSALFAPYLSPVSSPSLLFPTTIPGTIYSTGTPPTYFCNYSGGAPSYVPNNTPKRLVAPPGYKKTTRLQVLDRDEMRVAIHAAAALHRAKAGIASRACDLEETGYGCHSRCVHHKRLIALPLNPGHRERC